MRILLCNDDGIDALGINTLALALQNEHQLTMVAPDWQRSASSHGLTVAQPLRARRSPRSAVADAWSVDGLPADCVKLALEKLLPARPDLVVSGINHGANLGNDTIYSGTVAGALEGAMYGLPAIAVSLVDGTANMEFAARFVRDYIKDLAASELFPQLVLNINVPAIPPEQIKGYRYTKLGIRSYHHAFDERIDPRGETYYWLHGQVSDLPMGGASDAEAIASGYISITPLLYDLTDYSLLRQLAPGSRDNP